MPSQTRSSSRLRSSAAKKIQKRFRGKKTRKQVNKLKSSRKIQARVRGKQTRKVINREKNTSTTVNDCPICLEPMTNNVRIALPCGHRFHADCIRQSLTSTRGRCPNCRTDVTNIPYPSIQQIQAQAQAQAQEQEQEIQPLILDPILRRQYILERMREIELWEREIEELRPQVPDPPEIPNIHFNDALSNQYSADQTEYYVRRLYNEASYNYNNYRSLNINDETLEQDVTNMFFITSELLTRARDNARNADRICNHIGDIEFAEYM
jgi:hypothetical protein